MHLLEIPLNSSPWSSRQRCQHWTCPPSRLWPVQASPARGPSPLVPALQPPDLSVRLTDTILFHTRVLARPVYFAWDAVTLVLKVKIHLSLGFQLRNFTSMGKLLLDLHRPGLGPCATCSHNFLYSRFLLNPVSSHFWWFVFLFPQLDGTLCEDGMVVLNTSA